ncbi:MAG: hypothetical protein NVSMB62_17970 [Acidobacteriaceae bacterium]
MVCQSCGSPTAGPGTFCPRCGTQVVAYSTGPAAVPPPGYPPPPGYLPQAYSRVSRHLQALGILWFVYGAYRAASGLFAALVLAGFAHNGFERFGLPGRMWGIPHSPFLGAMAGFVIVYTGISAALAFVTGYGLSARLHWARILAIVAAILALFHPISGTALGIYTLWVLAPQTSANEYDAIADRP